MNPVLKNFLTLTISLLISTIGLEVGLRIFTPYPIDSASNLIEHPVLGYVMDPQMSDIDSQGFRNEELSSIDIIALGDSHTYGFNVKSHKSWPYLLGRMIGKNVYNMGIGGYGILQYKHLLDKSIEAHPKVIMLALYLPNDLNDVCRLASCNDYWSSSNNEKFHINSELCPKKLPKKLIVAAMVHKKDKYAITSIMSEFFNSFKLSKKITNQTFENAIVISDNKVKTAISHKRIEAHRNYMDVEKPHIKMAFDALKEFLIEAKTKSKKNDIHFGVLLIPSKESVLFEYLLKNGYDISREYRELFKNEKKIKKNTIGQLNMMNIPYVDILHDMQNALNQYGNVYPPSDDGHPNEIGYRIYAENALKLYNKMTK